MDVQIASISSVAEKTTNLISHAQKALSTVNVDGLNFNQSLEDLASSTTSVENDALSLQKGQKVFELNSVLIQQLIDPILRESLSMNSEDKLSTDFHSTMFMRSIADLLAQADAFGIEAMLEKRVK